MSSLAEELLIEFLTQKQQLADSAGVKHTPLPNWQRAVSLWLPHMEAMAAVVGDWDIPPSVIMQAAFDRAKRNRHPDGPQMTMLKSQKYLVDALSHHLNLPVAAIMENRGGRLAMEQMDQAYSEVRFPADILGFTVEDPCFRYVRARETNDDIAAVMLAREVLSRVAADRRMDQWMAHRGFSYEAVAAHYHGVSENLMKLPDLEYHE